MAQRLAPPEKGSGRCVDEHVVGECNGHIVFVIQLCVLEMFFSHQPCGMLRHVFEMKISFVEWINFMTCSTVHIFVLFT